MIRYIVLIVLLAPALFLLAVAISRIGLQTSQGIAIWIVAASVIALLFAIPNDNALRRHEEALRRTNPELDEQHRAHEDQRWITRFGLIACAVAGAGLLYFTTR